MSVTIKGIDNVEKAMNELIQSRNSQVKSVYFDLLSKVIDDTPVDEGTAKNNWHLGAVSSVRSASQSGAGSMADVASLPQFVLDKKIVFINPLPYIARLEYGGHSQQKPRGWVRGLIEKAASKVNQL